MIENNNIQVFIQQILNNLPSWSEGAVIVKNGLNVPFILPVAKSKSKFNKNGYYSSFTWRPIQHNIPLIILKSLVGKMIWKNGTIVNVFILDDGNKYFSIKFSKN